MMALSWLVFASVNPPRQSRNATAVVKKAIFFVCSYSNHVVAKTVETNDYFSFQKFLGGSDMMHARHQAGIRHARRKRLTEKVWSKITCCYTSSMCFGNTSVAAPVA
mmetsp:Transcript_5479/g.10053  ORF Transcript_5479/g.10053 Transcript_5479/m.10053 type:complete len:107 (-) Transcript_5479:13-333(-)